MSSLQEGITVFTPTYNRAKTLVRLYNSLLRQSADAFEWLIVDDGSTDDTKKVIDGFIEQNKIDVRYIHKNNGGKHTAVNVGMQNAKREYFMCVDSDDFLTDDAIETLMECINKLHPDGIIAYKSELGKNGILGKEFPENIEYTTLFHLTNNLSCGGERTLVHKTVYLRNIHIPEPVGQKFFPEPYLYDKFDLKYESYLLPKNICICEYMESGYSANFRMLMIDNAISMKWFFGERLDFPCSFKQRFEAAFRYDAYSMLIKSKEGKYVGRHKAMLWVAFPVGLAMYIVYSRYRRKMKRRRLNDEG